MGWGKMHRDKQFAGLQNIAPGTCAKVLGGDLTCTVGTRDFSGHRVGDQHRDRVGARGGVAEIAANRSTALDLNTSDQRGAIDETRIGFLDSSVAVNLVAGHRGSECKTVRGIERHLVQGGNILDVDDQIRVSATRPELHEHVGAAGQHLSFSIPAEQADGLLHAAGTFVVNPPQ